MWESNICAIANSDEYPQHASKKWVMICLFFVLILWPPGVEIFVPSCFCIVHVFVLSYIIL